MKCIRDAATTAALAIGFFLCFVESNAISAPFDTEIDRICRIIVQNAPAIVKKIDDYVYSPDRSNLIRKTDSQERREHRDNIVEEFLNFVRALLPQERFDQTPFLSALCEPSNERNDAVLLEVRHFCASAYNAYVLLPEHHGPLDWNIDVINLNNAPQNTQP